MIVEVKQSFDSIPTEDEVTTVSIGTSLAGVLSGANLFPALSTLADLLFVDNPTTSVSLRNWGFFMV